MSTRIRRHDPEPGADGAGGGEHRHAFLRRHPGDRHDRPHRHQPARRRDQPGRRHRPRATLLAIVLVAAPLAVHVPLAVLAGILLFVAWNMGEWTRLPSHERVLVRAARQAVQHVSAHRPGRPHGGDGGRPGGRLRRLRLPHGHAVPGRARRAPCRVRTGRRRLPPLRLAVLRRGRQAGGAARPAGAGNDDAGARCAPARLDRCLGSRRLRERAPDARRKPGSGSSSSASTSSRSRR